jgi:hypothetical protein
LLPSRLKATSLPGVTPSGLASQAGKSARPAPYIADNVLRCAAGAAARAKPTTTRETLQ